MPRREFSTASFCTSRILSTPFRLKSPPTSPCSIFLGYVTAFGLPGSDFTGNGQVQLPYFLLYGHSLHQGIDKAVHVLRRFLRLHGGGAYKGGCK